MHLRIFHFRTQKFSKREPAPHPQLGNTNMSDIIIYLDGLDPTVETAETDRNTLSWTAYQQDLMGQVAEMGETHDCGTNGSSLQGSSKYVCQIIRSAGLWGLNRPRSEALEGPAPHTVDPDIFSRAKNQHGEKTTKLPMARAIGTMSKPMRYASVRIIWPFHPSESSTMR